MDKTLIAEASKHLRLRGINLYEGHLKRFEAIPETDQLGQQTKLAIKADKITMSSQQTTSIWRVFVDLGVRVVNLDVSDGVDPNPLYQIEACYQVDYELTAPIEQTALDEFTHFNAVHNVWPFWRQYVFSMANQAGLPCPEIPLKMCLQNHDEHTQEPV